MEAFKSILTTSSCEEYRETKDDDNVKEKIGVAGFIDVETTGLSPITEEIIEFAICLFTFNRETGEIIQVVDKYVGLREPGKPIPMSASRVHGLYFKDVKGKNLDIDRVHVLLHKAEFLIAHNASFDRGFVVKLFDICQRKPWLCSMNGIKWKNKGFTSKALQNLLRDHGISVDRSHRAEDDVLNAVKLLGTKSRDGKYYFHELLHQLEKFKNGA